jgi:uncharacterized protein (DUF2249 family)
MSSPQSFKTTIDVRAIVPRERHPLIFGTFDTLLPGEALLLINDHDPKPLFYQFQAESAGQFTWEYLENGPEVWQVKIGKAEGAAAPVVAKACACNH